MWTKINRPKKNPLTFKTTINNLINKTFGTHKQTHKHMAGKRWQGGKDGAMIKKRRFGRAVGFILIHILPTICVMYSIKNICFSKNHHKQQLKQQTFSLPTTEFILREYSVRC